MDHELLHNDRGDYDLRLKAKKDKDKNEPGERKKWNFRKSSTSEASGNDGPSTFGLINPSSESKSKRTVSPTMIFENALSDHDEPNDIQHAKSPPTSLNLSQSATPVTRVSPKTPSADQGNKITRARQHSLPNERSLSPPPVINRPQSVRKADRINRQVSVPTLLQQQSLPSPFVTPERSDLTKPVNDVPDNSQWQSLPQPYFSPDNLSNVIETSTQDNQPHKARTLSNKDTAGVEILDNNKNTMWQGNEEIIPGTWTDFLSPSNEVFAPDDQAWAGTENVVVDVEDGDVAPRNVSHSSRSSNSSESDNEDTEESVWRINDEQRAYYLNQFRILQPAEKGVVAGQKARDFFLKSELGTDVLSKIWNLADMDSDGALNFDEFCIAMHIVVAVRHGLDVPATLPPYLLPEKYETQAVIPQKVETNSNELSSQDSSQSWARFSPDPRSEVSETDGRMAQAVGTTVQPAPQHAPSAVQHVQPHGQHVQPVNQHAHQANQLAIQPGQQHPQQLRQQQQAEVTQHSQQVNQHTQPVAQHEQPVAQPSQPVTQHPIPSARRLERTMSDPSSADENTSKENSTHTPRKISLGIPRVRGQPKQTNLLDTPHWAILPPPSKFNKENPEETGKGNQFVPTGTIIPADPEDHSKLVIPEKPDQVLTRDSESDSSSSETEETKERAKSLSHEHEESNSSLSKNSSENSLGVSQDSVDGGKKLPAPVPPPRRRSGHSRSSSLDLQKLFNKGGNTASLQNASDSPKESTRETEENFANFDEFNKFQNTTVSHSNENISRPAHKRSASLDSAHAVFVETTSQYAVVEKVEDTPNARPEVSASVPRPVPKKKPASPPPPLLSIQKKEVQQDSGSDGVIEKEKKSKEPIHFVVKPLTRLEQLHAKIRDLKTKNTRLSRINNELQQELKEMMEKRVGLESSLEQLKPFAK